MAWRRSGVRIPLPPQCEVSGHRSLDVPRFLCSGALVCRVIVPPFLVRNPVTHYTRVVLDLLCWVKACFSPKNVNKTNKRGVYPTHWIELCWVNAVGACGDVADLRWRKAERCGGDGPMTDSAKRTVRRIALRSFAHFAPIYRTS